MNDMLIAPLLALLYVWGFWGLYVLVMGLYRAKLAGRLTGPALYLGYPFVGIGYAVDILANFTIATALFLDLPRETLVTSRLKRYYAQGVAVVGWRYTLAVFICQN